MSVLIGNPGWFPSNFAQIALTALMVCWAIAEIANRFISISNSNRNGRDYGSQPLILAAVFVALFLSFYLRSMHIGIFKNAVQYAGIVLGFVGILIRQATIAALGKNFTVRVETGKDRKLITTGLYRYIRHPSYTGGLLTLAAVPIAIGDWAGAVAALIISVPAYIYRIRIEEAALVSAFEGYREYMRKSWKLIPGF
jgi:protein-S-isoprenylcysteine O-methyltransferase Ste14